MMFLAGKSFTAINKTLKSRGAVFVSPRINLNGLVLKADSHFSKEALEFFSTKGMKITINPAGSGEDKLILLTGDFEITKTEIDEFLEGHPEFKMQGNGEEANNTTADSTKKETKETKENNETKSVKEAIGVQDWVKATLSVNSKLVALSALEDGWTLENNSVVMCSKSILKKVQENIKSEVQREELYTHMPASFHVGANLTTTAKTFKVSGTHMFVGNLVQTKCDELLWNSVKHAETQTGFMTTCIAGNSMTFQSKSVSIQDTLAACTTVMAFVASEETTLGFDKDYCWLNADKLPPVMAFAYTAAASKTEGQSSDNAQQQKTTKNTT